ncbi:unnamed protein product [Brassica oleracea]
MEDLEQQFSEGLILSTSRHETHASNSVREYSLDPIPDDLLVEIFSLVPLKSVARFSCVSKYWASILRHHDFTELFLTKSLTCRRLRSEKFGFINIDEDMLPNHFVFSGPLFNYKGKLGIHCRVERNLVLWVLEDAGNHKWCKHSYLLPPLRYTIPTECMFVGMASTCEIVYSWNSSVWFYNLEWNTVKRVNIQGLEGIEHPTFINTFVDYAENMNFM